MHLHRSGIGVALIGAVAIVGWCSMATPMLAADRDLDGGAPALTAMQAVDATASLTAKGADRAAFVTTVPGVVQVAAQGPSAGGQRGAICHLNAGGCPLDPVGTLQVGIAGGEFFHGCAGPDDEWVSLAYPIYGTTAGHTIVSINITHNSNSGVGSLYLMGDHPGCADLAPDINNILWTGDSVIQGNGTGTETRYCIAAADGGPILSPGGTIWVVAAFHDASFTFDIAFDCVDPGSPGQAFGQLGGVHISSGPFDSLSLDRSESE